jgi:hypothetical protein
VTNSLNPFSVIYRLSGFCGADATVPIGLASEMLLLRSVGSTMRYFRAIHLVPSRFNLNLKVRLARHGTGAVWQRENARGIDSDFTGEYFLRAI